MEQKTCEIIKAHYIHIRLKIVEKRQRFVGSGERKDERLELRQPQRKDVLLQVVHGLSKAAFAAFFGLSSQ